MTRLLMLIRERTALKISLQPMWQAGKKRKNTHNSEGDKDPRVSLLQQQQVCGRRLERRCVGLKLRAERCRHAIGRHGRSHGQRRPEVGPKQWKHCRAAAGSPNCTELPDSQGSLHTFTFRGRKRGREGGGGLTKGWTLGGVDLMHCYRHANVCKQYTNTIHPAFLL